MTFPWSVCENAHAYSQICSGFFDFFPDFT
jgi:hypothetical protein